MKQIIFYKGKSKRRLKFDSKYARESEDGSAWIIVIPDPKRPDLGIKHHIPKKDISDIVDYVYPTRRKKTKNLNHLTGF